MSKYDYDVIIIGAGLSGIAAAYYLQSRCPDKTFTILEGREAIGGTWDLFRYPGIRSDSDMYTLGYTFRPWDNPEAIADGPSILKYVNETAEDYGIDKKIQFQHRVCGASWSSDEASWTVDIQTGKDGGIKQLTCNFLFTCTGYYDYDAGYTPEWDSLEQFQGTVVHPQKWTDDIDYTDKKVVVIGSGATAVTLVPAMAKKAAHVTMLQRSPTYIVSRPAEDALANWMNRYLPRKLAYQITRWRIILFGMLFYQMTRRRPEKTKQTVIDMVREELGDGFDIETHFTPTYYPWDQRLCLVPDGDLFNVMKSGTASVVTDHIDYFTETGIQLKSGKHLEADMIVTATGLVMKIMKGVQLSVDGEPVNLGDTFAYKGAMYSNIPNLASAFGYTNASWTLKCELISEYVCRLLNYMDKNAYQQCTPVLNSASIEKEPLLSFSSGYVKRALDTLPSQGSEKPWKAYQNYVLDIFAFRYGKLEDGTMIFSKKATQ